MPAKRPVQRRGRLAAAGQRLGPPSDRVGLGLEVPVLDDRDAVAAGVADAPLALLDDVGQLVAEHAAPP